MKSGNGPWPLSTGYFGVRLAGLPPQSDFDNSPVPPAGFRGKALDFPGETEPFKPDRNENKIEGAVRLFSRRSHGSVGDVVNYR